MLPDPVLLFFSTSFPTLVRSRVWCQLLSVCAVCGVIWWWRRPAWVCLAGERRQASWESCLDVVELCVCVCVV